VLWVSYPKGASKANADINRDTIRKYAQTLGLTTVSLIAVDDVWSALRLKSV
jgi:ribosomal protein L25 (general stress protein Ctc)